MQDRTSALACPGGQRPGEGNSRPDVEAGAGWGRDTGRGVAQGSSWREGRAWLAAGGEPAPERPSSQALALCSFVEFQHPFFSFLSRNNFTHIPCWSITWQEQEVHMAGREMTSTPPPHKTQGLGCLQASWGLLWPRTVNGDLQMPELASQS